MRWKVLLLALAAIVFIVSCVPPENAEEKTALAGLAISKGCYDADNDGYGRSGYSISSCPRSTKLFDCNDYTVVVYPGATEECFDGLDNNCDGFHEARNPPDVVCGPYSCTETLEGTLTLHASNGQERVIGNSSSYCGNSSTQLVETGCPTGVIQYNSIPGSTNTTCPSGTTCTDPDGSAGLEPAYCSACGNGIIDSDEICDDGNTIAGDGCTLCRCADSDSRIYTTTDTGNGGINQYLSGTVTTADGTFDDYCDLTIATFGARSIFERYCGDDGTVQTVERRCGNNTDPQYLNEYHAIGLNCVNNQSNIPVCVLVG